MQKMLPYIQNTSTTRSFKTAIVAGDPTPYKFFAYGDQGIDKFPQGQGTAQNVIKDIQEDEYRLVFHNGDISYALGYVSLYLFVFLFDIIWG